MRASWSLVPVAAACLLALGACSKQADRNANAPGNPGTGNTAEVVKPAAPDSPPGGPSGVAGSSPHTGSSGGDVPVGATGSGNTATAQPGTGLNGGLRDGGATAMGAAPVPGGSTNNTTGSSFGNRP